jgi:hypothetical protein
MNSPHSPDPSQDFQLASLVELLEQQDEAMRTLFVKAINLYAAPGTGGLSEREKIEQLRQALEQSMATPRS